MIAATLTRPNARPASKPESAPAKVLPAKPDRPLWNTDKAEAFEAGVRWFLAVSRAA